MVLNSLTVVVAPQRVDMLNTAVGMEANPITFADFFYAQGRFITGLRKLKCRMLNVVVKKPGPGGNKSFLMSLDLRYMHAGMVQAGDFVNEETIKVAHCRSDAVYKELLGLEERFEEVIEDEDSAWGRGRFRPLREDESHETW